jgi:hypothetical protein
MASLTALEGKSSQLGLSWLVIICFWLLSLFLERIECEILLLENRIRVLKTAATVGDIYCSLSL